MHHAAQPLRACLSARGIELRLAEDADEALDIVREWVPDVLVLDAHLPGMNGFELLQTLRVLPGMQSVPAFMCSADARSPLLPHLTRLASLLRLPRPHWRYMGVFQRVARAIA